MFTVKNKANSYHLLVYSVQGWFDADTFFGRGTRFLPSRGFIVE